jgi:hypothetical protein
MSAVDSVWFAGESVVHGKHGKHRDYNHGGFQIESMRLCVPLGLGTTRVHAMKTELFAILEIVFACTRGPATASTLQTLRFPAEKCVTALPGCGGSPQCCGKRCRHGTARAVGGGRAGYSRAGNAGLPRNAHVGVHVVPVAAGELFGRATVDGDAEQVTLPALDVRSGVIQILAVR